MSLREVEAVIDWLGVDRCHQATWYWKETLADIQSDPLTAAPSRVAAMTNRWRLMAKRSGSTPGLALSRNYCKR